MVFSSAVFLFIFLPIVLILHTVVKNTKIRNGLLIVASLIFYAFGEPIYILMLVGSVAVNWIFGNILYKNKNKIILALAVVLNLLLLVVFKYTGFLVGIFNGVFNTEIHVPHIVMPIGISFFTFQAISYVVDVYRQKTSNKAGFFDVLLYIALFPQLIAGPIVQYRTIADSIKDREVTVDGLMVGARKFIVGLSKKMLISNAMGMVADKVFNMSAEGIDSPLAWFAAICYCLQIYFDFSGYSDMALGIGSMLGFEFPKNFDHPYVAVGIRDFWRRWHMSLTGWFREYLYIPLGGNRKGKARQILNSMIVFICTGIWHGANLTFLVWGFYHGVLMSVETATTKKDTKPPKPMVPVIWFVTMVMVIVGFVIFRSDNISYAVQYIGKMFAFAGTDDGMRVLISFLTPSFIATFVISLVACCPVKELFRKKCKRVFEVGSYVVSLVLFALCVLSLASNSYNPFIYFRF